MATAFSEFAKTAATQLRTQKLAELQEVVTAWPKLSPELRTAVVAVTPAARNCRE